MLLDSHLAKCCTWFDRPFNALQLCLCVDRHATLYCKVFIKLAAINTRAEEESGVGQSWLLIQPTPSAISQAPPTVDELGRWLLFLTCQPPTERWLDLSLSNFYQRKSWTFRMKLKLTKRANIQFLRKKNQLSQSLFLRGTGSISANVPRGLISVRLKLQPRGGGGQRLHVTNVGLIAPIQIDEMAWQQ